MRTSPFRILNAEHCPEMIFKSLIRCCFELTPSSFWRMGSSHSARITPSMDSCAKFIWYFFIPSRSSSLRTWNRWTNNQRATTTKIKNSMDVCITAYCVGILALSTGHSQILSRSHEGKSGEGLGSLLHHGPEMVDTVSTNQVRIMYEPSPPFPVREIVLIPGLLPIFLHSCEIKSGSGLGTRL